MTGPLRRSMARLAVLACLLALVPALAQEAGDGVEVTAELIQSRLRAEQESADLDEVAKGRLADLYQQSIASLETERANRQAADAYRQAVTDAPTQTTAIRESIDQRRATDPVDDSRVTATTKADELERILENELANLAAVEAKLAGLDTRLGSQAQRPAEARQRIGAVRVLVTETEGQVDDPPVPGESAVLAEARRWSLATRLRALQAEIAMLDQELRSHDARLQLLTAQRDEDALSVARIGRRVDVLQSALNERRRDAAERAMTQATEMLAGTSAGEPAVRALAEANLALVDVLRVQVGELEALSKLESRTRPRTARLAEAFRSTRRKLQLAGSSAPLGAAIREQREQLPNASRYAQQRRDVGRAIAVASLRLIENEDERRALSDLETYAAQRLPLPAAGALPPAAQADVASLAETRRALLDRVVADDLAQMRRLHALDGVLLELREETQAYDDFLAQRLLWVRSAEAIGVADFGALPGEIAAFLSPEAWLETATLATQGWWRGPAIAIAALAAALLFALRKRLRAALAARGRSVGNVKKDSMRLTAEALGLTLLLALPGPLVPAAVAWTLATADGATTFSTAVALALLSSVRLLLLIVAFRELYEPDGVADRHFGWNRSTLPDLRRRLGWFVALGVPLLFVTASVVRMDPATSGGTLGLLGMTGFMVCLAGLIIAVLHPTRGTIRRFLGRHQDGFWWRWRGVWFPLTIAIPITLVVLALLGFKHTAGELFDRVSQSIWLLTGVWVGRSIVRRWLMLTRRRLAYGAAVAARAAAVAAREGAGVEQPAAPETGVTGTTAEIGGPEVDLVALDADSRKLLNATVALLVVLGLVGIWGGMIPALGVLQEVNLWSTTALVNGIESLVPVTLADVLLAVIIAIGGYIVATNLPSLLDIILLKQGTVSAGARYAISALSRYASAAIATLLALGLLGASWSQVGWAVAALSVGIGFGLQEIVANFICGIILLFERPVRVGDVVTIGADSGTVSRIRIRATTIRDFEKKELIVPNKALITGQLVNWTLSDGLIRVSVNVGVAYGTDMERAMALLYEIAAENERILADPAPFVLFNLFGESSLGLTMHTHVASLADRGLAINELHTAIDRRFREAGIKIPFPQRDLHVISGEALPATRGDEVTSRDEPVSV